jgi:hypothetical protein
VAVSFVKKVITKAVSAISAIDVCFSTLEPIASIMTTLTETLLVASAAKSFGGIRGLIYVGSFYLPKQ